MATFTVTSGTDNFKGTTGPDEFDVTKVTDLSAADKLAGNTGADTLLFKTGGGTLFDNQFTGVTSVETVTADNVQLHVELGALAAKAGVTTVDGSAGTTDFQVDASAFTNAAGISVTGASSADNKFIGSAFGDRFTITSGQLGGTSDLNGGAGFDKLMVSTLGPTITDVQFANVSDFEELDVGGATASVTFGANAGAAGLSIVDGTAVTTQLTVNASAYTGLGATVKGSKDATYLVTGSSEDDTLSLIFTNTQANTFDGGTQDEGTRFGDVLEYVGDGKAAIAVNDAQLANVSDVETLRVTGAPTATVTLGQKSDDSGLWFVDGTGITGTFNFDASARSTGITVLSGPGVNNLVGSIGDDNFMFTNAGLLATDKVDGGGIGDTDRITITDKAALTDAVFAKVTHVEELAFAPFNGPAADYTGAKVVLGTNSVNAKLTTVSNETEYGLTLDATARLTNTTIFNGGSADDIFITDAGQNVFQGGGGDDSFRIKLLGFDGLDTFDGGGGTNEIRILDSQDAKNPVATSIVDGDFAGVSHVQRLVFDGTGKQVTGLLQQNADDSGLAFIDGSKVSGGLNIDASNMFNTLTVIAGTGADNIKLGGNFVGVNQVFIQAAKLTIADTLSGGAAAFRELHFTDAIKLTDASFAGLTGNITDFHDLVFDNAAAGQSLVAGANFSGFQVNSGITNLVATTTNPASSFTFDFSKYGGAAVDVTGGAGNDVFIGGSVQQNFFGGAGDDSFRYASANFSGVQVEGGDGSADEVAILDAGNPGPFAIVNKAFTDIHDVEILRLGASKTGSYSLTLGTKFNSSAFETIDASLAGVNVTIDATSTAVTVGKTYILGAKDNSFTGNLSAFNFDTFVVDAKTFNANDKINAGTGVDTLQFSTGGAVSAAAFGGISNVERVQLSDAGNSVALTDQIFKGVFTLAPLEFQGVPYQFVGFGVIGGKGSDTIDFSAMTLSAGIGVIAGGGTDKIIGGAGDSFIAFEHAGDLTSADKIDGGGGDDTVVGAAGVYSSDQFKGFTNVENFSIFDADPTKGSVITIKNDFMATNAPSFIGLFRTFNVVIDPTMTGDDTVDASAVTGTQVLNIDSGGGNDTLAGGNGTDGFRFLADGNGGFQLDSNDKVNGGGELDTIQLTNGTGNLATLLDADLAGVSNVEWLVAVAGDDFSLELGANAAKGGINKVSFSNAITGKITLDATNYADGNLPAGLTVQWGSGKSNSITLGSGDDTLSVFDNTVLEGTDHVHGGIGNDRLELGGSTSFNDTGWTDVTGFEQVAMTGFVNSLTLGTKADTAGIKIVEASQAQGAVTINAQAMTHSLDIFGSIFGDTITGSTNDDVILGGAGKDGMTGNGGNDTFVFINLADSMQTPAGSLAPDHMDVIADFGAGDKVDLTAFGLTGKIDAVVAPTTFTTGNQPNFFTGAPGDTSVVVLHDATNTRLYVDVDGDGNLDLSKDLVVQFAGNQTANLDGKDSEILFSANGFLLRPHPKPIGDNGFTKLDLKTAGTYADSGFTGSFDRLVLSATTGNYDITLADHAAAAGLKVVDGGDVTGSLTVKASGFFSGLMFESGSGANTFVGTVGDDVFDFEAPNFTTADKIDGGASAHDRDVLYITGKSALVDAAFGGVSHVEVLEFSPVSFHTLVRSDVVGQKVTLGVKSQAAGIDQVINDHAIGLTVNATARNTGIRFDGGSSNDVLIASTFKVGSLDHDTFNGGGGDDSYRVKLASFTNDDAFNGGLGTDEVRILDSWDGATATLEVSDGDFSEFSSVERLVFDGTGKQKVTLDNDAGDSGLNFIDASKVAGGIELTISDNFGHRATVIAGTGKDKITFGDDGGDLMIASTKLTKDDTLDGGGDAKLHFTDAVKLTDAYFANLTTNVVNFIATELDFDNAAAGQSLVGGVNFAAFIANAGFTNVKAMTSQGFTADFSAYDGGGLSFIGGSGADVVTLDKVGAISVYAGKGDDIIKVSSAGFIGKFVTVTGEEGNDQLVILDAGTLDDTDFGGISDVETLVLGASKTGEYHLTNFGTNVGDFDQSGITTIDGSKAGVLVDIDATQMTTDMTLIAGAKANFISGGDGNDTIVYDAKTFDGLDDATGGTSLFGDTLKFSTGGVINTAAFGNGTVLDMEIIAFSDAGNSLVATNAVVDQAVDGAVVTLPGSGNQLFFDFVIQGGKGSDTVDLSALTGGQDIAVVGNGGADKFTGSSFDDAFVFPMAGDLTSADTVKGGGGDDALYLGAGVYKADAFKGVSSVEFILVNDPDGQTDASIALNSDFFKSIDLDDEGHRVVRIEFDAFSTGHNKVDGSAVTNAAASIQAIMGSGDDTFIGGAGGDVVEFQHNGKSSELNADDTVDGGLGWDAIQLSLNKSGSLLSDSIFAGVSRVEEFDLLNNTKGAASVSLDLDTNAEKSGLQLLDVSGIQGDVTLTAFGFTKGLTVNAGGGGEDDMTFGSGDDTVVFANGATLDSNKTTGDALDGGAGLDTLRFVGDATVIDDNLFFVEDFSRIELVDGAFNFTLGTAAEDSGIDTIDASKADSLVLDAHSMTDSITVIGSSGDDTIQTGSNDDAITGGAGKDLLTGKAGADSFVYTSTDDSILLAGGDLSRADTIADYNDAAGDTIDLSAFDLNATPVALATAIASLADIDTNATGFFTTKGDVAVKELGGATFVFADTNKDGNFTFNGDIVIKITGTHAADLINNGIDT